MLIIGGIWVLIAFNMNTTVSTGGQYIGSIYIPSTTVNNIGLMDERRNHLMMSALLIVVGVILFAFGNSAQTDNRKSNQTPILSTPIEDAKKCPYCAEMIKLEAIKCRFCGVMIDPDDVARQISEVENENSIKYRVLCSDGNCIGVIGADKKCKVCRRPMGSSTC